MDSPADRELPGLTVLLDPAKFIEIISDKLSESSFTVANCVIYYVRYKPSTNCIIAYKLSIVNNGEPAAIFAYAKIFRSEDFQAAADKLDNHRWIPVPGMEPVMALPQQGAILYFFPNDHIIDGLRVLSNPKKIQRILYDHLDKFPEDEWRISDKKLNIMTMRYKPERRAVIRCDTKAVNRETEKRKPLSVFMRIYAEDDGRRIFEAHRKIYDMSRSSGLFSVPRPIAYIPDRKLFVMEAIRGRQLLDELKGDNGVTAVTRTAFALASLQGFDKVEAEEKSWENCMVEAAATGEMVTRILPDQAEPADNILNELKRGHDSSFGKGLVHGDFYHGQVLYDDQDISIFDFDRLARGDTLMDVGNFIAHLRLLNLQDEIAVSREFEKAFTGAFERAVGRPIPHDNLNKWIAFGLFQLSVTPFRTANPQWRRLTESIIDECRRILDS